MSVLLSEHIFTFFKMSNFYSIRLLRLIFLRIIVGVLILLLITYLFCYEGYNKSSKHEVFHSSRETYGEFKIETYNSETLTEDIIEREKSYLEKSLKNYKYAKDTTLSNYTPVTLGIPLRSLIVASWRTGSTFVGEIINSVPGNYYHYEPLLQYGIVQFREISDSYDALRMLKKLFLCDYSGLSDYLAYGREHPYLFKHNFRLWNCCGASANLKWNDTFLSTFCKLFPFQSMKTVRIRLGVVEELFKDNRCVCVCVFAHT